MSDDPGLAQVYLHRDGKPSTDQLAVEEPLEIRVDGRSLAVVMRTPGEDLDLACGFLWTEDVIDGIDDVAGLGHCTEPARENAQNIVIVHLASGVRAAPERFERAQRQLYTASSCGLCGKASIETLYQRIEPFPTQRHVEPARVQRLAEQLRDYQPRFNATGGLHGAALFDADDELLWAREDVGRHNAVDKVLGAALQADRTELESTILVVSSRAGFEIVQKALVAGVGALIAIGAATSLADSLARTGNLALYSFVQKNGFNDHRD